MALGWRFVGQVKGALGDDCSGAWGEMGKECSSEWSRVRFRANQRVNNCSDVCDNPYRWGRRLSGH